MTQHEKRIRTRRLTLLAVPLLLAGGGVLPAAPSSAAGPVYCLGEQATVVGTEGDDFETGTPQRDVVQLLGGNDTYADLTGDDLVCLGDGNDQYGSDFNLANGSDKVSGGPGNDTVFGFGGADVLRGNEGSDQIRGGNGADTLGGGEGDDDLVGEAGTDNANGGDGTDACDAETETACEG
ncbi:calcium-binding protein [Streptomyces sp. AN091965]|uniref:calcium-binding protein n=1 Tax=Streptomyces sp. AN091965 TaxID=2927803 RepID=UPI001F602858|nr:calcium-binding protein [Streptomyces sp. AN091965]MCI3935424.1 hypothetical protein [Streptomyces sp. AN091965]